VEPTCGPCLCGVGEDTGPAVIPGWSWSRPWSSLPRPTSRSGFGNAATQVARNPPPLGKQVGTSWVEPGSTATQHDVGRTDPVLWLGDGASVYDHLQARQVSRGQLGVLGVVGLDNSRFDGVA
jgi:hypothetical protein